MHSDCRDKSLRSTSEDLVPAAEWKHVQVEQEKETMKAQWGRTQVYDSIVLVRCVRPLRAVRVWQKCMY
jgi:hypothetical protein